MLILALALASASSQATVRPHPAPAAAPSEIDEENLPRLQTAAQLLRDKQPKEALDVLAIAIATYDGHFAGEARRRYCAMSPVETLGYMATAAKDKVDAVAISSNYCEALYMKGYALVDLGRVAEARAAYQQVIALAPMHAPYLTELGQLARVEKDWPRMLDTCTRAEGLAGLGAAALKAQYQGAALRCQGYALVEEHQFDEAEKRYRAALALNAGDQRSIGELKYIADQRARPAPH